MASKLNNLRAAHALLRSAIDLINDAGSTIGATAPAEIHALAVEAEAVAAALKATAEAGA